MLNGKELLILLGAAYVGFAEWTSTWWSQLPLCILVSEHHSSDRNTQLQTCATLFEGGARLVNFIWERINHENILAFGTVMIAVFTFTLWQSTKRLWSATKAAAERQEQDTRILQRAYLSVRPLGIETYRTKDYVLGMCNL
jgi:hypothetical protein